MEDQTLESNSEQTSHEDSTNKTNQVSEDQDQANTSSPVYEVNGQKMTAEQVVESYKNLQKDYTQKSQELAVQKKGQQSDDGESLTEEDQHSIEQIADLLAPALEKRGYVKSDQAITKDELRLQGILDRNPDLKGREQEIRDLSSLPYNKGKAWEDIIAQYGFSTVDKLSKARMSGDPVGFNSPNDKQKSITEMSPSEYNEWKKSQGVTGKISWK